MRPSFLTSDFVHVTDCSCVYKNQHIFYMYNVISCFPTFKMAIHPTMLIIVYSLFLGVYLAPISGSQSELDAVVTAARYIWGMKAPDEGWGTFTPRAHIALSFIDRKFFRIPDNLKEKMHKKLDDELDSLLKKTDPSLAALAVAINSQYATCKDPRDFKGKDSVDVLRKLTDEAMKSLGVKLPIVFLTLCLARDTRLQDADQLVNIYDSKHDNVALKALTIVAMSSCKHLVNSNLFEEMKYRAEDFMDRYKIEDNVSVYTKGLILQAHNAWGYYGQKSKELLQHQLDDGSFGDLLSTYAVIPALLNQSLVDLKCEREYKEKPSRKSLQLFQPERYIDISVIVPEGTDIGKHTIRITFVGRESLHELMETAQLRNPLYRYTCDELPTGKRVNSLAGIPNDVENGLNWNLFKRTSDALAAVIMETTEIDWVFPQDGDHFIWRLGE